MHDAKSLQDAVSDLYSVMQRLRRECPWDRVQTHSSLKRYLIEECHEVLEALDGDDPEALKAELGDLLFQIWFHAEIASERQILGFDLVDILETVRDKLVARHPHVFSTSEGSIDAETVQLNWEQRKLKEGRRSRLEGIPPLLPALLKAETLQRKAANVGFEWPEVDGAIDKVREELDEWLSAMSASKSDRPPSVEESNEFGDLLFSLVNVARYRGLNAEDALRGTCRRFRGRFQFIESRAESQGRDLETMSLEEMDRLWDEAKTLEEPRNPDDGTRA